MKKILVFLLLIIIPSIVCAELKEPYVAVINNKSGAYLYAYNTEKEEYLATDYKLEYGTKVLVVDDTIEYATLVNYVDVIQLSDIKKTNDSYEEYEKELAKVKDSVPILTNKRHEKSKENTLRIIEICVISVITLIFMIVIISYVHKRRNKK